MNQVFGTCFAGFIFKDSDELFSDDFPLLFWVGYAFQFLYEAFLRVCPDKVDWEFLEGFFDGFGFAFPRVAFITCPIRKERMPCLPPR